MASRLNQLFQVSPKGYLERTVLFTDELTSPESEALTSNQLVHHIDLEPINTRSKARLFRSLHEYSDMPLVSYFVPTKGSVLVPVDNPSHRFVFLPEFTCSRLLVRKNAEEYLKLSCEQGLVGPMPPAEQGPDSLFTDSFGYWEHTSGDLVGCIRATAVLVKEKNEPWTVIMQQIVGSPGFELVRKTFSRALRY
jgi:hypothetical protein